MITITIDMPKTFKIDLEHVIKYLNEHCWGRLPHSNTRDKYVKGNKMVFVPKTEDLGNKISFIMLLEDLSAIENVDIETMIQQIMEMD